MIKGFREFLLRGNVIDLAIAFVIGAAFTAVVNSFTESLVQPLVNLFLGGGVDGGKVVVNDQTFDFGRVINALITFLLTAAVVYFVVVAPMNKLKELQAARAGEPKEAEESDLDVLKDIRDELQAQRAAGDGRGPDPLR
jgi:large conductance mechanosensitive channel